MSGVTLQPFGDLPSKTGDAQRIRRMMLRRLRVLASAMLLMVGGVAVHFLFTAVPVGPTDWLLVSLAVTGTGFSLAGYRMAADLDSLSGLDEVRRRV